MRGLACCGLCLVVLAARPAAAEPEPAPLSAEVARALAVRHAPVLWFHPEEDYRPVSPLFPLDLFDGSATDGPPDPRGALGSPEARRARYLAFDAAERARLSTVYYRVRRLADDPGTAVIEYWLYYVWSAYSVKPGLFPFWFDGSHPNDLEHVHVVVSLDDDRVVEVHTSAHEGSAPANRYQMPSGRSAATRPHVLVERGSHAGAPDGDLDGRFTPGRDGDSGFKMLWGVRDRGLTWTRYNPDYMDPRAARSSPPLCPADAERSGGISTVCPTADPGYRLVPVDELYVQFDDLDLSAADTERLFEIDVHPFKRLLGRSNGEVEKLVLPPRAQTTTDGVAVNDFSATERGLAVGITTVASDPGFYVGGRYAFLHGVKALPDLLVQAEQVLTVFGDGFTSGALLFSYPIDAMTKVFGGGGVVAETRDLELWQQDWIGGLEFRFGGSRISVSGRSLGDLTRSALDVRFFYFF